MSLTRTVRRLQASSLEEGKSHFMHRIPREPFSHLLCKSRWTFAHIGYLVKRTLVRRCELGSVFWLAVALAMLGCSAGLGDTCSVRVCQEIVFEHGGREVAWHLGGVVAWLLVQLVTVARAVKL